MFTYEDLFILSSHRAHPLAHCKDALFGDIGDDLRICLTDVINSKKTPPEQIPNMLIMAVKDNASSIPIINLALSCFNICVKLEHCKLNTISTVGWMLYYRTSNGKLICPYIYVKPWYRKQGHALSMIQYLDTIVDKKAFESVVMKPFRKTQLTTSICYHINNRMLSMSNAQETTNGQPV